MAEKLFTGFKQLLNGFITFFLVIWATFSYISISNQTGLLNIAQKGMHMKTPNDLWGEPGKLPDKEVMHLITKLFALREDRLKKNPEDQAALIFLQKSS